jgi:GNAT superfamily N-acetyltransferase
VIRPARADDARALAEVQVRGWQRGYGDFVAGDEMPTVDEREARWREHLDAGEDIRVWDQDGSVAGVVSLGPSRDDGASPSTGEVYVIYVDPPAQGAGVGSALLEHAVEALRAAGFDAATLWVFTENGLARRFYEQRGWTPDGAEGDHAGAAGLRYRLEL